MVYFPRLEGEAEEAQDEEMEQVPGVDEEKDPRRSKLHRKHVVATQPDTEPTYYFDSFLSWIERDLPKKMKIWPSLSIRSYLIAGAEEAIPNRTH